MSMHSDSEVVYLTFMQLLRTAIKRKLVRVWISNVLNVLAKEIAIDNAVT